MSLVHTKITDLQLPMKAQQQIEIIASPEKIFQYLMDVENRVAYVPALEKVIMIDKGPIAAGSRYIEVAQIGGRRLETTYEVIEYEENKHTAARTIKSVFPIRADLDLIKEKDLTRLIITLEFKLKGIFKLGSKIIEGIVNQQAIGILRRIKKNVESAER